MAAGLVIGGLVAAGFALTPVLKDLYRKYSEGEIDVNQLEREAQRALSLRQRQTAERGAAREKGKQAIENTLMEQMRGAQSSMEAVGIAGTGMAHRPHLEEARKLAVATGVPLSRMVSSLTGRQVTAAELMYGDLGDRSDPLWNQYVDYLTNIDKEPAAGTVENQQQIMA